MRLSALIQNKIIGADPDITSLHEDSRGVTPGALFFAIPGSKQDGMAFVGDAVAKGAVAVVATRDIQDAGVPVVVHENPRALIAQCAARLYPQQPRNIVAITGTAGKTSTAYFVQQICNALGGRSVSLGTLGVAGAINEEGALTTPTAPMLHQTLDHLSTQGIAHVAMEASSQGLHQHRLDQVRIQAAAFTNLSRDHLDYHADMDDYFAAKTILFDRILPATGTAVINADDSHGQKLVDFCHARDVRVLTYGHANADICITMQNLRPHGQDITFTYGRAIYKLSVAIAGAFQAGNILCALGLCVAQGLDMPACVAAAANLQAPPGRLQPIMGHPLGAAIYVDYAHKPDALEHVLRGLRAHNPRRLVCVFGCGGDRDAGKRPMMGEIAARLADHVIVTDDNPRSENPATIRAAIMAAAPGARDIGDRRVAIHTAISELQAGDILVVAGKGHETGQKFATHTAPFSDIDECITSIATLLPRPNAQTGA